MRLAVFTVFYPGVESFVGEFLSSLAHQTDQDFTLYIINDGMYDFFKNISDYNGKIKTAEVKKQKTPGAIAKKGIQWLIEEGIDAVVLADSDDYFSKNRIEKCREKLFVGGCVFYDLILFGDDFGEPISMFDDRFTESSKVIKDEILHSNCLGFGNTAIRLSSDILSFFHKIPDDIVAFDWLFFTLYLNNNIQAVYSQHVYTYYRQHSSNIASPCVITKSQIFKGINIKIDHYSVLANIFKEDQYVYLLSLFSNMKVEFEKDESQFNKYCNLMQVRFANRIPLWWEAIQPIEELL
jgi:glycosyltransferase involved in cell wall biosynthesis